MGLRLLPEGLHGLLERAGLPVVGALHPLAEVLEPDEVHDEGVCSVREISTHHSTLPCTGRRKKRRSLLKKHVQRTDRARCNRRKSSGMPTGPRREFERTLKRVGDLLTLHKDFTQERGRPPPASQR